MEKIINPFSDINLPKEPNTQANETQDAGSFRQLSVGSGYLGFKSDEQGSWWGSNDFATAPAKVDMAGNATFNSLSVTGGVIKYGKTAFADTTNAGYYIGPDGFYFGAASDATYVKFNGTTLLVRGSLNADDITAGTLTGRTVQTASSGQRIVMGGTTNYISVYDSNNKERTRITGESGAYSGITWFDSAGNFSGTISGASSLLSLVGAGLDIDVTQDISMFAGFNGEVYLVAGSKTSIQNSLLITPSTITLGSDTVVANGGILYVKSAGDDKYVRLYHNDTNGYINSSSGQFHIVATGDNVFIDSMLLPGADNTHSLGLVSTLLRWTQVCAVNGTIQTSDLREKENVIPTSLGLDFINRLNPISYEWRKNKNGVHHGLIAQEVDTALGGVGFAGLDKSNPESYGLNYSEFVAPLVKSIQELSKRIEQLENKKEIKNG